MSIEFITDGAVAIVTLARPEKKNAMLLAMRDRLAELCEQINDSPELRAVVQGTFMTFVGPGSYVGPEEARVTSTEDGSFEFPAVRSGEWQLAGDLRL